MGITVFVVDDHEIVRRGIQDLLAAHAEISIVGEAATIAEATARLPLAAPDVAVIDLQLPDGTGVELCRALRISMPACQSVILTSFDDDQARVDAALAGAVGFVLKEVRGSAIVQTVLDAAAGRATMGDEITALVLEQIRFDDEAQERFHSLTAHEREILRLIADGKSNRQIADELFFAEKTIKNRVTTLLSKLGVTRRTEAAVYAARLQERYGALRNPSHL